MQISNNNLKCSIPILISPQNSITILFLHFSKVDTPPFLLQVSPLKNRSACIYCVVTHNAPRNFPNLFIYIIAVTKNNTNDIKDM